MNEQTTHEATPHGSIAPMLDKNEKPPEIKDSKKDFEKMVTYFLSNNPSVKVDYKMSELEVRFGTNPKKYRPISKQDYDNTVQQLFSAGFTTLNSNGLHILRINNEYMNEKKGVMMMSNIRAEIVGIDLVQEYCRTNSIQKILDMPSTISANSDKLKFTQKSPPPPPNLRNADFYDFNFRVSHQLEQDYIPRSNIAKNIITKWNDSRKTFRYLNRVRFSHPDYPIFADLSIVRGSDTSNRVPIPQYTIQEAKVLTTQEKYEIELEVDNSRVGPGTNFNTPKSLLDAIRKTIRIVMSGLQGTNYPISFAERDKILQSYIKLLHGEDILNKRMNSREGFRVFNKDFSGPSSYTLQIENVTLENEQSNIPNIRSNYSVTDKADGERKLLYISENGRIYMIDTNMNVIFTGLMTEEKKVHESLIDGEFIKYNKKGNICNLYAAFDIYFINTKSVREMGFMPQLETDLENKFRLPLLQKLLSLLKPKSILEKSETGLKKDSGMPTEESLSCNFMIKCKDFYKSEGSIELNNIFQGCSEILSKVSDNLYEYNTDGLIFTPVNTGVGSNRIGHAGSLFKTTWEQSFKWKPPEFNTIDFLVNIKKDKTGQDEVHNIFQEGKSLQGVQDVLQYKTLELMCGFNSDEHVYKNPWLDIINDKVPVPSPNDLEDVKKYEPKLFIPINPFDPNASYCNVMLKQNGNNQLVLLTEEHEYFEGDTIVEFKYDETKTGAWKWIPLRVRYDKTYELRTKKNNFGNAFHVANSNWTSIHNPVTQEMITTGKNIPEISTNDDVYYNRSSKETSTIGLRNFHNLYVKRKLIMGVSQRKDTLIDYAVGKGGDLNKWVDAKLGFVFGIDVSKDNIHNNLDGACARYLNLRRKHKMMHHALFTHGNSGSNIRNGDAFTTEKDREIAKAVFGNGPKDRTILGEGVYRQYGIAVDGFQISSVQFALHYFFENNVVFHQFLRNVSECTRVNGYFIGTCYDGQTVFDLLKKKNEGESITIMRDEKKMYEITKKYAQSGFPDDENSLGYPIDIYQETINKVAREYLVNYKFLVRIIEDYGFVPLSQDEARKMGFPHSSGLFEELFSYMENEIRQNKIDTANYGSAPFMSYEEKRISFMNRYFIFKKIRNVNTENIFKILEKEKIIDDFEEIQEEQEEVKTAVPKKIRKLKVPKIVISEYYPIVDTNSPPEIPVVISEPEKIITFKRPKIKK